MCDLLLLANFQAVLLFICGKIEMLIVVRRPTYGSKRGFVDKAPLSNPRCASKRSSRHHLTECGVGPTRIFLAISCGFRHK